MSALVLGHMNPDTDSIVAAIAAADLYSKRGFDVTPAAQGAPTPETEFVLKKFGLQRSPGSQRRGRQGSVSGGLPDLAQAPQGMDSATVLGIVDHHKLGDVTTSSPLEAWIWPVGCTGTVLKNMYDFYGVEIPKNIAGGLCAIPFRHWSSSNPRPVPKLTKSRGSSGQNRRVSDGGLGHEMFVVDGTSMHDPVFRDYKDFGT